MATVYDAAGHACSSSDDQVITDQASLSFILLLVLGWHPTRCVNTLIPLILSLSLSLSLYSSSVVRNFVCLPKTPIIHCWIAAGSHPRFSPAAACRERGTRAYTHHAPRAPTQSADPPPAR